MATFPSETELFNPSLTGAAANALVKQWFDTTRQLPGAQPLKTFVIANDAITPTQEMCVVDTEGGAQADNLSVINTLELQEGALLNLRRADVNRVVTLVHSTAANGLRLYGAVNKVLGVNESVTLRREGNYWREDVSQLGADALRAADAAYINSTIFSLDMAWHNTIDYLTPCLRIGSNGRVYQWLKQSGPKVNGVGVKDPAVPGNEL